MLQQHHAHPRRHLITSRLHAVRSCSAVGNRESGVNNALLALCGIAEFIERLDGVQTPAVTLAVKMKLWNLGAYSAISFTAMFTCVEDGGMTVMGGAVMGRAVISAEDVYHYLAINYALIAFVLSHLVL